MALEERISKHLGKPYIYLPKYKKFLCANGVIFTKEEYRNIDMNAEYERREKEDMLYDYIYAKNTGILRKKRGYAVAGTEGQTQETVRVSADTRPVHEREQDLVASTNRLSETANPSRIGWVDRSLFESKNHNGGASVTDNRIDPPKTVWFIVVLLAFTSFISMYISTLHTATYLRDYVEIISAWLMSASITAYNSTAFEVSVIFKLKKRYFLSGVFIFLWTLVTLFSMTTTVSVFYDRFNFNEVQTSQENKGFDSAKLELELLQKKEASLRESIEFKKKDIEYRQERDYATTAVRLELADLENQLQENLEEQKNVLSDTPDIVQEEVKRKESLFAFLGRKLKIEGGILEFIMSTLSAIFINLIAPISMTAVTEIVRKERLTK